MTSEITTSRRSEGQKFLVGDTLYFRPVKPGDGMSAPIWRKNPFPVPAEVVDKEIRERLEKGIMSEIKQQLLLACRRSDDRPVGSADLDMSNWRYVEFDLHVDPILSDAEQDRLMAEMIDLLLTWTIRERNVMTVKLLGPAGRPATNAVISNHGGRVAARYRERLLVKGVWRDAIVYQVFNPFWAEKLGHPPHHQEGPVERDVRSPAQPCTRCSEEDRPDGAFAVGDRVYLRPFDPEDGEKVERWSIEETEIHFPEGRWMVNGLAYGESFKKPTDGTLPKRIFFAIVDRETRELIGVNGIFDVDWVNRTGETMTELFQPKHRNSGLGTEAKHLLLGYAFETVGLHSIVSGVSETNPRSANALRKQGYRDAGYLAWDEFSPGGFCGAWLFDLLATEWRKARSSAIRLERCP